jgi:hypothetical protein
MSTTPTIREICLVAILLASLLVLSQKNYDFSFQRASPPTEADRNHSSPLHDSILTASDDFAFRAAPLDWRTRLRWADLQVPQTQIVAHVPGAF